jgi:hypothetical protein
MLPPPSDGLTQRPSPPVRRVLHAGSALACAAVWLAAVSVAIRYVRHFAQRFPFADDWNMSVPVLARLQPLTLGWLWSQYNEHRSFIPRLAFVALGRVDGGDFRAPVLLDVAALAVVAAAFLLAAHRRRGASSPSDCFFVFMLLHLLQSSVFWGAQFQFVSSTFFFCLVAFVICFGERLTAGALAAIALLTLALPLCGGNGLVLTPPLAAWLFALGVRRMRQGERRAGAVALGGALAVAVLALGYLVGWQAIARQWQAPTLGAAAVVAARFVAAGLGPDFAILWPLGGLIVGGLLAATAIVLGRAVGREGVDGRALPMLALVAALALLAATVGWGRAGRGSWEFFFEYHYAPLALPMLCVVYLVSLSYGPRRAGLVVRWSLFLLLGILYYDTLPRGKHPHVAEMEAFAADLAAGLPAHELVERHIHLLASSDTPEERRNVEHNLQGLLDAGYYGRK